MALARQASSSIRQDSLFDPALGSGRINLIPIVETCAKLNPLPPEKSPEHAQPGNYAKASGRLCQVPYAPRSLLRYYSARTHTNPLCRWLLARPLAENVEKEGGDAGTEIGIPTLSLGSSC